MKIIICFFVIIAIFSCDSMSANSNRTDILKSSEISIIYKGYYVPVDSHLYSQLIFTIQNNTNDTLYISSDHINAEVIKNGHILEKELLPGKSDLFPPDFLAEWVFTTDVSNPASNLNREGKERRMQLVDSLKKSFAKKLYDRNPDVKKHFTEDFFYVAIRSVCLVILPKERINYDRLFISASLDNTCSVHSIYKRTKTFTTLNGVKVIDLQ